jgi:hypothetical protein
MFEFKSVIAMHRRITVEALQKSGLAPIHPFLAKTNATAQ